MDIFSAVLSKKFTTMFAQRASNPFWGKRIITLHLFKKPNCSRNARQPSLRKSVEPNSIYKQTNLFVLDRQFLQMQSIG